MGQWIMHFDGLCAKNPGGVLAWGWSLTDPDGVERAFGSEGRRPRPEHSNNVAEWYALGVGLKSVMSVIEEFGIPALLVRGDSSLVITQVTGVWECHDPKMLILRDRVWNLQNRIAIPVSYEWIRREMNARADELSRAGYREITGTDPPEYPRKNKRGT